MLILMHFCGMNINMFDSKMLHQTPLRCYRKYGICIIFLSKIPTILSSETHLAQRVWMKDYVPALSEISISLIPVFLSTVFEIFI